MNWYLGALKKYAVFKGRARRREYWSFTGINLLISFALGFLGGFLGMADADGSSLLTTVYWLAVLLPAIAVGVRRMHDAGHGGWWLILPIVNLIFALQDSQPGDNEYGPNPKAAAPAPA